TKFRKNEEWSSMTAIAVVSMIEDEYGVMLNINDLKPMNTIEELYNFVKGKI
ncbi:MAG: acyl carrier protein, partial [Prevotella sp.]|nr:acyl carrier protein [Prevotella sp.]